VIRNFEKGRDEMGIFDFVKKGAQELFIARPDDFKGQLVYKHPDPTIPNHAQVTVGQDECALFFKNGQFVGRLDAAGSPHKLDTQNIPFLDQIVDKFTGGNLYKAELWFVTLREVAGWKFGGRIGDVEDPKSGLAIQLMVYGDFSIQVTDPAQVAAFFGQRSWSTSDEFDGWFKGLVLKIARDRIAELCVKQNVPLLNVTSGALTEEVEAVVLTGVAPQLSPYGMKAVRLGNFVVSMKDEDEAQLKALYKDAAQMRLASSGNMAAYQQFAAGKAMMGAGEGMAKGGGEGGGNPMLGGAALGVGVGMAQMFNQANQNNQNNQNNNQQQPGGPVTAQAAPQSALRALIGLATSKLATVQDPDTKTRLEGLIRDIKGAVAKGDKVKQGELETELNDLMFVLE
jgi:membrane protease subunit (stomatin/prohibitin family)